MAEFTTNAVSLVDGDSSSVDTTPKHQLGTIVGDKDGNEYIYLLGVASTEAGSWVSFDENHATTLLVANAKGRVGVAMAATVANTYGWYQIYGKNTIAKALTGFADNGLIYSTATAGSIDDAVVSGDLVVGAIGRSAVSGGVITAELNRPFATDTLG
jgi:hypothetical protein